MKKYKKAPQTVRGQRGKNQVNGEINHTLSKELKVLSWIYEQSIKGLRVTTFDSFNHNADTSFRTHISELCYKYGLEILRRYVKNPNTGTYYKEYWLSNNDIVKVKKILNK